MTDTCVCCGEYVVEGKQVCTQCMSAADMSKVSDKTILHIRIRCQVLDQFKEAIEAIKEIESHFNCHIEIEVTNYLPVADRHNVSTM